jgi:hypothetical protein
MTKPIKISKSIADILKAEARCTLNTFESAIVDLNVRGDFLGECYPDDSRALAQDIINLISEQVRLRTLAEVGMADPIYAKVAATGAYGDVLQWCADDDARLRDCTVAEFAHAVVADSEDRVIVVGPMSFDSIRQLYWFRVGFRHKNGDECILKYAKPDNKIRRILIKALKAQRRAVEIRETGSGSGTAIIGALQPIASWKSPRTS